MSSLRVLLTLWLGVALAPCLWPEHARGEPACRVVQHEKRVELHSPFFVFRLDTACGLRARSWENRLAGRTVQLGDGPELEFDIGLPGHPLQTPPLEVSAVQVKAEGEAGEAVFQLTATDPAACASVAYRWDAKQPVLRKFVTIANNGAQQWNRLLNVRLGTYRTDALVECLKEPGFPAYLGGEFFLGLAHPAGWALGAPAAMQIPPQPDYSLPDSGARGEISTVVASVKDGQVSLRQHPGIKAPPGKWFQCMEAVYGVAKAGAAHEMFVAHMRSRMRRVLRGHDKPYAIFEPFGGMPGAEGDWLQTEEYLLDNIAKVAQGQRETGCRFDYYSLEFWVDFKGDLKRCDPQRFPNGLTKIRAEIAKLGTAPGLWIDSSMGANSIGGNPAVAPTFTDPAKASSNPGAAVMCRAMEPIKSMYTAAFRHHIRENGVRLLKFDNLIRTCTNPSHDHLPGVFSTEAIDDAVIEFLEALDKECPDVFLMLYWGYRSPWWLLYADTLFESGVCIEAANPSDQPALRARDSVTQMLDQGQWLARKVRDIPALGKDSLGIFLSDWGTLLSQIGKERWKSGFVMDICRGSLLAQPWTDTPWLSPPERKQMAEFIALLKARPECFGNPRFVLGDPWKNEPYGYCCTDGRRALLALNNACWKDSLLSLELNSAWGLPDGQAWDLYRWYPDPARLRSAGAAFGPRASMALRPFEIVLLEVVPHGEPPTLNPRFQSQPIPVHFAEASRSIEVRVAEKPAGLRSVVIGGQIPASGSGGTLVVSVKATKGSAPARSWSIGSHFSINGNVAGQAVACQAVLGRKTQPSCWQAWRIAVERSAKPEPFELTVATTLPRDLKLTCKSYLLPK